MESIHKLSVDLQVSAPTVKEVVREKRGITPEMAVLLAKYFRGLLSSTGSIAQPRKMILSKCRRRRLRKEA
jgi:hypothetical protein